MKTAKGNSETVHHDANIDVDALLAAINEISESEVTRAQDSEDPHKVSIDGRTWHTYTELAEAFELDIHDFSVGEVNR